MTCTLPSRLARSLTGQSCSFHVDPENGIRKLSVGEDAAIHDAIEDTDPLREELLALIKFDGAFYTTDADVEDVKLGTQYLVDGETVITPTSKSNRVAERGPITEITEDKFLPNHEDIYVIQRENPFGRFEYRTNKVRRFLRSDRVEELVTVAPA